MTPCPLCLDPTTEFLTAIKESHYLSCPTCKLIFLRPDQRVNRDQELDRYKEHRNSADDPTYRNFLSPLVDAIAEQLTPGSVGLDFGSGPGPAVPTMLKEKGFDVSTYDPFFSPETNVLEQTYDFVTCTETAEHFFNPKREFELLGSLLNKGGWLGIMTRFIDDPESFIRSQYHRDPTHVCFYSTPTFSWLGRKQDWRASFPAKNVVLFHRA